MRLNTFQIPETTITLESMIENSKKAQALPFSPHAPDSASQMGEVCCFPLKNGFIFSSQGDCETQEDRYFYGEVSDETHSVETIGQALFNASVEMGARLLSSNENSGSTGTFCYVQKDTIVSCQVGDSAAVLISVEEDNIRVQRLTQRHAPSDLAELARIKKCGGFKSLCHRNKYFRNLAVSRSFGDRHMYFQSNQEINSHGFTFEPSISCASINVSAENYLLLMSDGLEGFTLEELKEIIKKLRGTEHFFELASEELHQLSCKKGQDDNRTSILLKLTPNENGFLYGVCDGHDGSGSAAKIKSQFPGLFGSILSSKPSYFPGVDISFENAVRQYLYFFVPGHFKIPPPPRLAAKYHGNYKPTSIFTPGPIELNETPCVLRFK